MRTATFISYIAFFFFGLFALVHAAPEPVQVGSILARDVDAVPALDGLGGLIARGDKDHDHDYCWDKHGWGKCSKWNYCCKKDETCCGDNQCCGKGYKCYRKGKDDDDHHKRGDDDHHHGGDDDHHGGDDHHGKDDDHHGKDDDHHGKDDHHGYKHGYKWVCKKDEHHW